MTSADVAWTRGFDADTEWVRQMSLGIFYLRASMFSKVILEEQGHITSLRAQYEITVPVTALPQGKV
jgi:hypothetical protein